MLKSLSYLCHSFTRKSYIIFLTAIFFHFWMRMTKIMEHNIQYFQLDSRLIPTIKFRCKSTISTSRTKSNKIARWNFIFSSIKKKKIFLWGGELLTVPRISMVARSYYYLIPKPNKDITRKLETNMPYGYRCKTQQNISKWIQQHIKKDVHL